MSDDEDMEEYFEDQQTETEIPPLKIIDETRYLDEDLGGLLLEIYDRNGATIDELSVDQPVPESQIKQRVGELRKQGYLGVDYEGDTKRYFVSSDWGTHEFPSGPIIPLVYQFNLLSDEQRMAALKRAIVRSVGEDDVVADLGAGVGMLSHLAAERAEQVYAVEMDREVYEKGKEIVEKHDVDNVTYLRGDAREIDLPEKVDVVMCELLDTALIAELQVPVLNYAVDELLRDDGSVIPAEARTSMRLIESDYDFYDTTFRIPHFEEYGSRESEIRSEQAVYHHVSFDERNSEIVEERVTLEATESGVVNGVQLNTDVRFAEGLEYTGSSPWLDPPLNLPFEDDWSLTEGETLTIEINYELGGGLSNIAYDVVDE